MKDLQQNAEGRRLLNPAFMAICITTAASGHREVSADGMPLAYGFLIPPLVLHQDTREHLPKSVVTKLISWSEKNGHLVARLPKRLAELRPFTSQGLLVATTSNLSELSANARLIPKIEQSLLLKHTRRTGSVEFENILKKAFFVGKWLASAGTPATVFTALGMILENDAA